jgi:hypothetical protein
MRTTGQRKLDALNKLETDQDVWVATAGQGGIAHLVPLSLCWHEARVVVAVERASRTARNATGSGRARLALGPTRDVVVIDAAVTVKARSDADPAIVTAYRHRAGWDPGADGGEWLYLLLQPTTIQVWREVDEIAGRTVMRRGAWLA